MQLALTVKTKKIRLVMFTSNFRWVNYTVHLMKNGKPGCINSQDFKSTYPLQANVGGIISRENMGNLAGCSGAIALQ